MSEVEVTVSDRALARVAAHAALTTPGVVELRAALAGRVQSLVRGRSDAELAAVTVTRDDSPTTVSVQVGVALDPPPLHTVEQVAERVRAEVLRLTGQTVAVEVVVTGIG